MNYRIIKEVEVLKGNATGKTRHFREGIELPLPVKLQIACYPEEEDEFYLFYLNSTGEIMTDTYHTTIDSAFRQANREFAITPEDWNEIGQ